METMDYFSKNWRDIYHSFDETTLFNKEREIARSKINTEYLYWSKAKHYAKAFELTEDELWAITKSSRRSSYVELLPIFRDEGSYWSLHFLEMIYKKTYEIDGLLIQIEQVKEPDMDDLLESYYIDGLIEEAFETSRIEGAQTKRKEAFDLIRLSKTPKDTHEQMILNAYKTKKKWIKDPRPLSKEIIRELHNDLIEHTKTKQDEYEYRSSDVEIVNTQQKIIFKPVTGQKKIIESIEELSDWVEGRGPFNQFVHPLIKAILAHFWVAYVHPFYDGNGRTARMLFYKTLLREPRYKLLSHVPISTVIRKTRKDYENAFLFTEHDDLINKDFDLNYFVTYHLNVIQKSLEEFRDHLSKTQNNLKKLSQELKHLKLNWRQLALYHHALKHPDNTYTIGSHCMSHNITRITATKDLGNLVIHGLFVESKSGKTRYFSILKKSA